MMSKTRSLFVVFAALAIAGCQSGGPSGADGATDVVDDDASGPITTTDVPIASDGAIDAPAIDDIASEDATDEADVSEDAATTDASGLNGSLVGDWAYSRSQSGITLTATLHLGGDAQLTFAVSGSGSCSGTVLWSGATWSADDTTLHKQGAFTCSGGPVQCTVNGITVDGYSCATGATQQPFSTCGGVPYSLSTDDTMLTITACNGMSTTLTRAN